MEDNTKTKEVIGKINYYGFKGEIAETIEYTDKESYLNAIKKEMDYNPDGFNYVTLTQDPQTRKAADDVVYDAYGVDNPHTMEYYSPKIEDIQYTIKQMDGLKKSLMFGGNGLLDIRGMIDEKNMYQFIEKYDLQKGAKTYEDIIGGHELSVAGEKFINEFNMKVMTAAYQELQRIDRMDIIQEVKANRSFEEDITIIETKLNEKQYSKNKEDMNAQEKEDYLFVQDKRFSHLFSTLPESRRTYNVSWAAVEAEPSNLAYVPDKHLDEEIIKMAAQKDGFAIEYIPSHKLTTEICNIAVNQNGGALEFVPAKMLTPDMILFTIKKIEGYKADIPENIGKGNNIYTFHKKVEDVVNKPLSYDEHKKLYAGESLNVGTVHTHSGNIFPNCVLTYNKENNTLNLRNIAIDKKKQPKEAIKPTHQKPTKTRGRKL